MEQIKQQINEQEAVITEAKNYLNDTDYLGHREYEGGEPMPNDVKTRRAKARADINTAQAVITQLKAQLVEAEEAQSTQGEEA